MIRGKGALLFVLVLAAIAVYLSVPGCSPEARGAQGAPALDDAEIGRLVREAVDAYLDLLDLDPREAIFSVNISVSQGVVTLSGETSEESLKEGLLGRLGEISGITLADELEVLPSPSMGEKVFGIVKVPVVDLGDGPRSSGGSHTVTQARMGDIVKLLKEKDGWFLVQMHDGYLGWVGPESIHRASGEEVQSIRTGRAALVVAKTAHAYSEPGGEPLFPKALVQGSVLPLLAEEGGWVKVGLPGGPAAWMESSGVMVFEDMDSVFSEEKGVHAVIETAKQYLGLPYLWGGTTAYGFDCSGFTQFVMRMNGYFLRRDADMQFEQGEEVPSRDELQPGDLVFFETYKKGPSHVGIYIGDSQYIQSGSQTGVSIQSFNPDHPNYMERLDKAYLGARRIIK